MAPPAGPTPQASEPAPAPGDAPTSSASSASNASSAAPAVSESYLDEVVDDDAEGDGDESEPAAASASAMPHPLDGWSDARIAEVAATEPSALGSLSVGKPNAGGLVNGVQMPEDEHWTLTDPANAWGTSETIAALSTCLTRLYQHDPRAPRVWIGHVSARRGGHLRPHVSHQAGRDVDIGYWYTDEARWYARATASNLDRARTWAFLRCIVIESDVEMILADVSVQKLLREHAEAAGEEAAWVDDLFRGTPGVRPPLFRHAPGHGTHLHLRFHSPIARETARRAWPALVARGVVQLPPAYATHVAKRGETLAMIAKKYGTTLPALRSVNGLANNRIIAGRAYRIPVRSERPAPPTSAPIRVPGRRLPPR